MHREHLFRVALADVRQQGHQARAAGFRRAGLQGQASSAQIQLKVAKCESENDDFFALRCSAPRTEEFLLLRIGTSAA